MELGVEVPERRPSGASRWVGTADGGGTGTAGTSGVSSVASMSPGATVERIVVSL